MKKKKNGDGDGDGVATRQVLSRPDSRVDEFIQHEKVYVCMCMCVCVFKKIIHYLRQWQVVKSQAFGIGFTFEWFQVN